MADPARDLDEALARMRFIIEPGRFALLGFSDPPDPADAEALAPPAQMIREADETSLLVGEAALPALLARHPDARVERGLVWIRFEVAMGWDVVGFLARVSGALSAAGVPIGAVCGYSRDHIFVGEAHLERTRATLRELFPQSQQTSP